MNENNLKSILDNEKAKQSNLDCVRPEFKN